MNLPPRQQNEDALQAALAWDELPRSAAYEPRWMLQNLMGPNAVWLAEALSQVMRLQPGMRMLNMGCGRAIGSIFLARGFDLPACPPIWSFHSPAWWRTRWERSGTVDVESVGPCSV